MTSFALVLDNNIIQINPTIFPVAVPMVWTTDITSVSPSPQVGWTATENNGVWSFLAPAGPTLAQAQVTQRGIISSACSAAIIAGFASSALGSINTYDCNSIDQENINLVAAHGGSLWTLPAGGNWTFTAHTMAQGVQVQSDMLTHIQAQQTMYAGLLTQINAANTVAAVQAIVWP